MDKILPNLPKLPLESTGSQEQLFENLHFEEASKIAIFAKKADFCSFLSFQY